MCAGSTVHMYIVLDHEAFSVNLTSLAPIACSACYARAFTAVIALQRCRIVILLGSDDECSMYVSLLHPIVKRQNRTKRSSSKQTIVEVIP